MSAHHSNNRALETDSFSLHRCIQLKRHIARTQNHTVANGHLHLPPLTVIAYVRWQCTLSSHLLRVISWMPLEYFRVYTHHSFCFYHFLCIQSFDNFQVVAEIQCIWPNVWKRFFWIDNLYDRYLLSRKRYMELKWFQSLELK